MEKRTITIVSTKNHSKKVIESAAETLGQLKEELRAADFDFDGMTFFEGLSKSELTSDESILPKDIPYKGAVTNNLVFMLTNPDKKISSGGERSDLYNKIKELGLQDKVKEEYGKNYTMVSNEELKEVIAGSNKAEEKPATVSAPTGVVNTKDTVARAAITALVDSLLCNGSIEDEDAEEVRDILKKDAPYEVLAPKEDEKESPYSDSELDDIFGGF
jgi:hypothetical protein